MEPYNIWADLFDTYQSLSDGLKLLWLIVPPAFVIGLVAVVLRLRVDLKQADHGFTGRLIYSIHRDSEDQLHVVAHAPDDGGPPTLLLLNPEKRTARAL